MEDHTISDSAITSTYSYDYAQAPSGRLNLPIGRSSLGAWKPKVQDLNQWLQVEFQAEFDIIQIATQGGSQSGEFVTSYALSYGQEDANLTLYGNGKVNKLCMKGADLPNYYYYFYYYYRYH